MKLFPAKSILAVAALSLAVASTAQADTLTFGPAVIPTPTPFTIYTQDGFTVTQGALGQFVENMAQGNPPEGLSAGRIVPGSNATDSLVVTDGGSKFSLDGIDINDYGFAGLTYEFIGSIAGVVVFDTGALSDTQGAGWFTFADSDSGASVDRVSIIISNSTNSSYFTVDNVTTAPEPNSLILAGSGLLGFAAAMRRRIAA